MDLKQLLKSEVNGSQIGHILFSQETAKDNTFHFDYNEFRENYFYSLEKGLTIYGPDLCLIINNFIEYFRINDEFATFVELAFPRLLTSDIADNFELTTLFPYYLLKTKAKNSSHYSPAIRDNQEFILDPVQCPWFYQIIANDNNKIIYPFKVRESLGGWSYRNESYHKIEPLIKDITFLRYEFVFAGSNIDVKEIRINLLSDFCSFLNKINIPYRIVIGDGCYDIMPKVFSKKLNSSSNYSEIPVLDVEVYIPHKNEWLEISGASYLGSDKINRFINSKLYIETGCFGIGLSRLAYAFLANNGLDKNKWLEILNNENLHSKKRFN